MSRTKITEATAASCPHNYCTSGICVRFTTAERQELKVIAIRYMTAGDVLIGRAYDGATLLLEDGEARSVYNLRTKHNEITR